MPTTPKPSPVLFDSNSSHVYRKNSTSPFKIARFSPYKLSRKSPLLLELTGHSHAHPNPSPPKYSLPTHSNVFSFTHEGEEFLATRHVKLDFELFRDGKPCIPSSEQNRAIMALFPTSFLLSFSPPFLVVACLKLPAKPWPITVAGIPLYLTTDAKSSPMNFGLDGRGLKAYTDANIDRWKTPDMETFKKIFRLFDNLDANIHRLQWIGSCFLALGVSEPYPDWRTRLPFTINDIRIGYIFGEQTEHEKAFRRKLPAGRVPDNEIYRDLRPGVMVTSKSLDQEAYDIMTTSGVCLQSPSGTKYITIAKHGFPGGVDDQVLHPSRAGHRIAEVTKVFGETDIAITKLADVHYSRETFSTAEAPTRPFRNLLDISHAHIYDFIFMDTPFNGRCEGVLMKVDVLRVPTDEPAGEIQYVVGSFSYFGNGADTLLDGCCGGVIWNSDYDVLGQFGLEKHGIDQLSYCSSFDQLRCLGYTLSDV